MKLQFLGFSKAERTGCAVCGSRRRTSIGIQREKRMMMPHGKMMTFHAGKEYDLSDADGAFLLRQKDSAGRAVFKKAE